MAKERRIDLFVIEPNEQLQELVYVRVQQCDTNYVIEQWSRGIDGTKR